MFKSHSTNAHACELGKKINSVMTVLVTWERTDWTSGVQIREGRRNGFMMQLSAYIFPHHSVFSITIIIYFSS